MKNLKTLLILCGAGLWSISLSAQNSDSLYVYTTDGAVLSFNLDDLQKITFTDSDVVIEPATGNLSSFLFDAIRKLSFEAPVITAIPSLPEQSKSRIFYSPQTQNVVLESETLIGSVAIYNMQGVMLKNIVLQSTRAEIPVDKLPAGIYIVRTVEYVKKFIKN
ncbi:MAG: T9SS type A sorting domain-containing protein [Dysgonamonadaceae bacterium]|jgi:hypothetical protein|nr:T9SS type A sorting domain-containing protein [Dysgonamonadaceae bacterium]